MELKGWKFIASALSLLFFIMLDSWFWHQPNGPWWRAGVGIILYIFTLCSALLTITLGAELLTD